MPCPRQDFHLVRKNRNDVDFFLLFGNYLCFFTRIGYQYFEGLIQVANGGSNAPDAQLRQLLFQVRKCKLCHHAALRTQQLMPLIYGETFEVFKKPLMVFLTQHEMQALRGYQQNIGHLTCLLLLHLRICVTVTYAYLPVKTDLGQGFLHCARNIFGQRTQRCHPNQF